MTTIEQVRAKLGLSSPQMLAVLGAKPGRKSLLAATDDSTIDEIFLHRARALSNQYDTWKASIIQQISQRSHTSLADLAHIFNCDRFTLYQSKRRGTFHVERPNGKRDSTVTLDTVRELFSLNESVTTHSIRLTDHNGHHRTAVRGPLADIFLKHIGFEYKPPYTAQPQQIPETEEQSA